MQTIAGMRTKQMAGGAAAERHKEMVFGGPLPWNASFETDTQESPTYTRMCRTTQSQLWKVYSTKSPQNTCK